MRTRKHRPHIAPILTLSLVWVMLAQSICADSLYGSDSVLELSRTGGYAELSDANVDYLDYSKGFSIEVLTKIEPHSIGGRWASFIQKSGSRALYLASEPGFVIGINQGHLEHFGQQITVKVGDGTNHVTVTSSMLEGDVYAVMTWDSTEKELILYINGNEAINKSNTQINPLNIKNSYGLKVGIGTYGSLKRDVFMMRMWNRKLSSSEISSLYNNYNVTGQHILPSGFSENELKSEWLMQQTSDAIGSSGTTHIKDTKGTNHLELKDGAEISTGIGYLTVENPSNNATDVDKAVILRVKGGISDLGSIIKPLHYYFQIDESSSFNSPNLKESGWIKHYGKYKPILKPNTQYYWRVKVKDSNETPAESAYTSSQSFTTEGQTNWYVRPGVYSSYGSTPTPAQGIYGNQDGTSYENAWNGIREIVWGEDGVEAGDNLYVCGEHVYSTNGNDFLSYQAIEFIKESGFSEEYPITIRMDYSEDPGTLYGIWMDMRVNVVWNGPDSNGVYWTDNLYYGAVAEFNGTDYVWLDLEDSTSWIDHYGARYTTGGNTYVKTTDGSNPAGKIYSPELGFRFDLGRSKYIKFYKGNFYSSTVGYGQLTAIPADIRPPTHIIFDSCKMIYGVTYWLYAGHDYWVFRNNDFSHAGNGIYTKNAKNSWNDGWGSSYLLIENNTFKHFGTTNFPDADAHAVGVQGGRGHTIQGNYIEDTGSAIEFWTGYWPMKDMIIRNNFIKNIKVKTVTTGAGIAISGENRDDSIGKRTGFKIYNNIIINTGIGKTADWQGNGIGSNNKDPVVIYNNIIVNPAGNGINFGIINAPAQGTIYNNIIVNPGDRYLQIIGSPGDWSNFSSDYNLYYPATDFTTDFYFAQTIDRDNNSILADPLFVDPENGNFHLWSDSPAINAGVDVGLTQDFEGNPVPQGPAFDIGAYESVVDPDNPTPVLQAIGNKSVNENVTLTFDINATDPDGEPITYSVQSLPSGATFPSPFSWTPSYDQAGSYQVRFIASDGNSNDSETITITVNNVNRAPVLESIGNQSVNENALLSFSVNATDPDGQTLTYSVSGLPSGTVFAGQTFTWTPSYDQAGTHSVTFTADDGQAQDSETITITVVNVNRAPVLTAIGNRTAYADVLLTFTIDATDPDGDAITYSAGTPLPSGATFTDQGFNWTPSQSQVGSYAVTFTASDGQLQDSEAVTLTVDVDNLAPTVTNCSPAASSIQVPLNNLITLNIVDAGIGVDADSVKIKIRINNNPNNDTVYFGDTDHYTSPYGDCRRLGTKADYRFVYQSTNEMFYYDQTVTITVNATDLAGNVMNEYSYSFATEMHSFGQNKQVNSGLDNSDRPVTVCDSSGNIWAAWHAGAVGNRDIYISKLAAGEENFGGTVQLTDNMTDQCNPAVALDSTDKLYIVWQDNREGDWDIYVSTSVDGISWSTETRVNDPNDGNQVNPAVVIDGQNYAHVVWQDDRAGNQDICIATSSDDFATKTVSQITSDSSDQIEPAVAAAADLNNTIYVVWTDGRNGSNDIYGAASKNPWTNVAIVSNVNNQSSPAIAAESTGSILHLLWVDNTSGDNDIYYASSDGLLGSPLTGSSIIDDSSGADQLDPTIAVTGSTDNNLKVFACWQDWRNTDTDLYFAELSAGSGTNVFVEDGGSSAYQGEPIIGIGEYDHPYIVWADSRSTNTDIYYTGSTFVEPVALASELVTASASSSTTVGTDPQAITTIDDVSIVVPAGACSYDVTITVTKIANLPAFAAPCLGGYDFGPSGIQFSQPVTITIPYVFSGSDGSVTPYWFNSLTGALSQQGITDIQDIPISSSLHALSFKTTHFTAFFLFAGGGASAIVGGGGGGGGCSVSASGEGNIIEYMLPYIALAVVMAILKMRDSRDRKARNMTAGKC